MNGHVLDLRRDRDWDAWYALCTTCPTWAGQPEENRPDAIRHHTVHSLQSWAPVEPALAVAR